MTYSNVSNSSIFVLPSSWFTDHWRSSASRKWLICSYALCPCDTCQSRTTSSNDSRQFGSIWDHDPVVSWLPESHSLVIFEAARAESIVSERSKPCFARDPRFPSIWSGWQRHNEIQRNFHHLLYLKSLSQNGKLKIPICQVQQVSHVTMLRWRFGYRTSTCFVAAAQHPRGLAHHLFCILLWQLFLLNLLFPVFRLRSSRSLHRTKTSDMHISLPVAATRSSCSTAR